MADTPVQHPAARRNCRDVVPVQHDRLPQGAEALARNKPLHDKNIFIAHGNQDKLVPVDKARRAVAILKSAGAKVTYCEDDVGHKLSTNCFLGLESFIIKHQ